MHTVVSFDENRVKNNIVAKVLKPVKIKNFRHSPSKFVYFECHTQMFLDMYFFQNCKPAKPGFLEDVYVPVFQSGNKHFSR